MLLQLNESLADRIVRLLCEHQSLSALELVNSLTEEIGKISAQAVYKQLNKLIDAQVVSKSKTRFALDVSWLINAHHFLTSVYERHEFKHTLLAQLEEKGRATWRFNSLANFHPFWTYLVVSLCFHAQAETLLQWTAYPWWSLINRTRKPGIRRAIRSEQKRWYVLLGEECYLTRLCVNDWQRELYLPRYAPPLLDKYQTATIVTVDDLVLKVEMTQKLTNRIKEYFQFVTKSSQIKKDKVQKLFAQPSKVSVVLTRNERKAQGLQKLFTKYC